MNLIRILPKVSKLKKWSKLLPWVMRGAKGKERPHAWRAESFGLLICKYLWQAASQHPAEAETGG